MEPVEAETETKGALFHTTASTPYRMERVAERRRALLVQLETRLSDWRMDQPKEYKKLAAAINSVMEKSMALGNLNVGLDAPDKEVDGLVHMEAVNDVTKDMEPVYAEAADKALHVITRGAKRLREAEDAAAREVEPLAKKARPELIENCKPPETDGDTKQLDRVIVSDSTQSDFVRMADLFATSDVLSAHKDPEFVAATPDDELPPAAVEDKE